MPKLKVETTHLYIMSYILVVNIVVGLNFSIMLLKNVAASLNSFLGNIHKWMSSIKMLQSYLSQWDSLLILWDLLIHTLWWGFYPVTSVGIKININHQHCQQKSMLWDIEASSRKGIIRHFLQALVLCLQSHQELAILNLFTELVSHILTLPCFGHQEDPQDIQFRQL